MIVNRTIFYTKKLLFIIITRLAFILSAAYLFLISIGLLYSDSLIFLPPSPNYQYTDDLVTLKSKSASDDSAQHNITARLLINPGARYTVLYSHGNAIDISGLYRLQQKFFNHGYSVITYDYSGYGLSEGEPSEQQVYNDVLAVYNYLIEQQKLSPGQIIAYGHSLGAAVATDLAFNRPVAGLILESPFTTAFRVKTVYPLVPFDKFSTLSKINRINTPVFILHGHDDPVIPFWHGEALYEAAIKPKKALWLNNVGHSRITHTNTFWPALAEFVTDISP